jgi:parvulin-like peptidyl-prolyl isomerase
VETPKGYHVLKVYERKGGKVAPYEDVKEAVLEVLLKKKRADRLITLLADLRENATLERLID